MASDPFEILELDASSSLEEVKARWKTLASQHHPDRGGDAGVFNCMRQAYQQAVKLAAKPKKCAVCNGTGKRQESHGFNTITMTCQVCYGKGTR